MDVGIITLLPEMFAAITEHGVSGRSFSRGLLSLQLLNPRDFTRDRHRTVDDKPFGGGPGMLMKTEPLTAAIASARQKLPQARVIYLSPQGAPLRQQRLAELASEEQLILLCGRYQGIDQRVIDREVDEELSLGDFVISGGELAAMVLLDGVARLQPGALGDSESASTDSFSAGLLHSPQYTRPAEFIAGEDSAGSRTVPPVLLSGDHQQIARWRMKQSLGVTWMKRPELIEKLELSKEQRMLLDDFKQEQKQEQNQE